MLGQQKYINTGQIEFMKIDTAKKQLKFITAEKIGTWSKIRTKIREKVDIKGNNTVYFFTFFLRKIRFQYMVPVYMQNAYTDIIEG